MKTRQFVFAPAIALLFAGIIMSRHRAAELEAGRRFGHLTAQQVLDRALPFCKAITPGVADLRLTASHTGPGSPNRCCPVSWHGETIENPAYIDFDPRNGEVRAVGCLPARKRNGRALDEREALRTAWEWMQLLGISAQSTDWRSDAPPKLGRAAWWMRWRARNRIATISVDAHSGRLVTLWVREEPMLSAPLRVRPAVAWGARANDTSHRTRRVALTPGADRPEVSRRTTT